MSGAKKFLIIDDHEVVLVGVRELLLQDFPDATIRTARSGTEAFEVLNNCSIEIVFLDVTLPVMNGYDIFPAIQKQYPEIKVILLTLNTGEGLVQHFMQQGVAGMLFKSNTDELTQAVNQVWAGGVYFSKEVKEVLDRSYQKRTRLPLSPRESELIELISKGRSSKQIADIMCLSENTINSYRQQLLKQTLTKNTDELIAFAYHNGLLT